jgi:hypothetical protein
MRFDYRIDGAGWATATLGDDNHQVAMTVSYLHNSLAQLAESVQALQAGQAEATVIFMDEPGEHHVVLRKVGGDAVSVQVRWFNDWASLKMYPADRYKVAFDGSSTLSEIRELVVAALARILAEYGVEGYREKWVEHEFPLDAYQMLLRAEQSAAAVRDRS